MLYDINLKYINDDRHNVVDLIHLKKILNQNKIKFVTKLKELEFCKYFFL
jgi:hypothetical protein